jgi:predicted dehydrogenase
MSNVDIVGFWNRDEVKGRRVTDSFGWKRYADRDLMIKETSPDVLLVVVNSSSITQVVTDCVKYGIPIVMETPVWDNTIPDLSKSSGVVIYVNEQTPYLPCEEFKMMLLETGEFGDPVVAMNDCRTFEYHGIAQLRRYIGQDRVPVEVTGCVTPRYDVSYKDNSGNLQHHTEGWEFGTIKFNTGQTAVYNFSSIYNRSPFRSPKSMRIYCTRGTISNNDNSFEVHLLKSTGDTARVDVDVTGDYMNSQRFSATVNGKRTVWERSDHDGSLNDQQLAIKSVLTRNLNAISSKDPALGYTSSSAFQDMQLLNAIRHCGHNRQVVIAR